MILKNKKSFIQFLNVASGQKEVSIVIAKNQKEQDDFVRILSENGFKKSGAVYELAENEKVYYVIEKDIDKDVYDFIVQYPTGQVEIFDRNTARSNIYSPEYENKAVLVLVIKNNLSKLRKKGINFMPAIGLAYQTQK